MAVPWRWNLVLRLRSRGRETESRCEMRAPRSWPQRMMACGVVEGGRRESRVEIRALPVAILVCGVERGEERP